MRSGSLSLSCFGCCTGRRGRSVRHYSLCICLLRPQRPQGGTYAGKSGTRGRRCWIRRTSLRWQASPLDSDDAALGSDLAQHISGAHQHVGCWCRTRTRESCSISYFYDRCYTLEQLPFLRGQSAAHPHSCCTTRNLTQIQHVVVRSASNSVDRVSEARAR